LLLCGGFNQDRPGGVDGVAVAAEDVRPDGGKVLAMIDSD